MKRQNRVTQAEWPIMQVLWEQGECTAAEIVSAVTARTGGTMRTVKTLLRRLVAKEAVTYTVDAHDARVYHYRAALTREECAAERTGSLLDTVFDRDAGDMLVQFMSGARLSLTEIERLEALLREKRKELDHEPDHRA